MKTIRVITLITLVLFLAIRRVFLLFSFVLSSLSLSHHHSLFLSKFVSAVTKSGNLVLFFVFNFIIIAIFLLGSSKTSSEDHFDSFSYLPPLVCEVESQPDNAKVDDYNDDNDEFVPRLAYVKYKQGKEFLLECFDDEDDSHGFHGHEEDNDDEGGDDDDDDVSSENDENEDLKRKFEEFIAKNNKKWREELVNDKCLWIVPA
ncbi:hypothetical protein LOK49_LG02G00588 [Camellia lanceoleosa]|uniref:Uncharacterized protein n=1 Tax=Camellia lanceoleosa TaxID=1840588 RepID=A0ACC0IIQ6_9ERIC|nr:hypothetical protein LOK49_LG02G00588 [Camellia lanceoleosa]